MLTGAGKERGHSILCRKSKSIKVETHKVKTTWVRTRSINAAIRLHGFQSHWITVQLTLQNLLSDDPEAGSRFQCLEPGMAG